MNEQEILTAYSQHGIDRSLERLARATILKAHMDFQDASYTETARYNLAHIIDNERRITVNAIVWQAMHKLGIPPAPPSPDEELPF